MEKNQISGGFFSPLEKATDVSCSIAFSGNPYSNTAYFLLHKFFPIPLKEPDKAKEEK